jgi:SAM-dependent methyltransferase
VRLADVVPWGRDLAEYRAMFALTGADLAGRVLDCGGGPASFAAEAAATAGASAPPGPGRVVAADPLYAFGAAAIEARVRATFATVVAQTRATAGRYVWDRYADADALGAARLAAMRRFLADYDAGRAAGRYVAAALPALPFPDGAFDLAVCSHLLFLYAEHLAADFHVAAARELLRVAAEVRVFPLLTLAGDPSPHVAPVRAALEADGHAVDTCRVAYEFQRGGHTMLRVRRGA